MKTLLFSIPLLFLNSCQVFYPHTTTRTYDLSGTITDSRTGKPVADATIAPLANEYKYIPTTPSTTSDSEGRFQLKRTTNFLWTTEILNYCCSSGRHEGGETYYHYLISKKGYRSVDFYVLGLDWHMRNRDRCQAGDIELVPGHSKTPDKLPKSKP